MTDWHIFWWFYTWGWKGAIHGEAWGWVIELTPAFFGAGMLSGLNASWSFMIGGILAWGLIGPLTIKYGVAVSKPISSAIPEYRNYFSMSAANNDFVNGGSPRYWLMWVSRLVIVILTYGAPNVLSHSARYCCATRSQKSPLQHPSSGARSSKYTAPSSLSTSPGRPDALAALSRTLCSTTHEQILVWVWTLALALSICGTLIVGKLSFNMDVGVGIFALLLALLFSFIGVQASGTTDVNPVVIPKTSQLVIGAPIKTAQTTNLVAGSLAGQAASQAST